MFGALPPSSSESLVRFSALFLTINLPTCEEPVKEIFEILLFLTRASPASSPLPGHTLTTPFGTPQSEIILANSTVP